VVVTDLRAVKAGVAEEEINNADLKRYL